MHIQAVSAARCAPPQDADLHTTMARATAALVACTTARIYDPQHEIPALVKFADAAETHRSAVLAHEQARHAHVRFAATHANDDPAHGELQDKLQQARQVLIGSQQELDAALVALRKARGGLV